MQFLILLAYTAGMTLFTIIGIVMVDLIAEWRNR